MALETERKAANGTIISTQGPDQGALGPGDFPVVLDGVSKAFPNGREAVDSLSLTVRPGEFVSLIGPSGCGKSTLLRLIAGLSPPSAGRVDVFGQPPTEARRTRRNLSFIFQEPTLMPWRTVLDNVILPLELMGVPAEERREKGVQALDLVGLSDTAELFPRQLSGGMKMRASIARGMCVEPRLLLMDEPFAAIDEINRKKLNEELHGLWHKRGLTVLFVTHNIYEAVFLSTRLVVLTSAPARIIGDISVPHPYPRTEGFRESREFASLVSQVWQLLEA